MDGSAKAQSADNQQTRFIMLIDRIVKAISKIIKTNRNITTALTVVVVLFLAGACSKDKPDTIAAIVDRSSLPRLHAAEITTVISDSGVTRYRISAPQWNVYDKASQPYWEFPDGIHFEKFNLNLKVDANIHARYARFNENEQLWELKGKVRSTNLQGELFETEQLFWNQREERFYSDSLIKITQKSHIITGIGFESNQSMTRYLIRQPQGIFPVDENKTENETNSSPNK